MSFPMPKHSAQKHKCLYLPYSAAGGHSLDFISQPWISFIYPVLQTFFYTKNSAPRKEELIGIFVKSYYIEEMMGGVSSRDL